MNKKMILIAIGCLLFIGGCTKNNFDTNIKSDIQVTNRDVALEIKKDTLTSTGLTLIMKNNSINDVLYGDDYELEIKKDGTWYKIDVKISFNSIGYVLKPKDIKEITINWENTYGKLASGNYRIIKSISYKDKPEYKNDFYISEEFKIDK